jgi:hypothetical protein
MPVEYPQIFDEHPGMGINASPFDADIYLDFDTPMGKCSAVYLSFIFQLPKWGFERVKIDEKIDVSPVFQQYYQLTIKQKQELENMIKAALASISAAVSDLEMLKHDLRKYKEFMDYFKMVEVGKKKKDEDLRMRGEQALKAIFIDQVDVHTDLPNTPIALRSIVGRWPTIIADFMKLKDEDTDPKKIADNYKVSEAEGVVLATKNKLYQEWRDELFKRTVEERFRTLLGLVEARKKSYYEYKEMIKPTLKRYKSITDGIGRMDLERAAFWRPESQAMSLDSAIIWAWKPFAAPEKYKAPREAPLDKIPLGKAGFKPEDIEELVKSGKLKEDELVVKALPVEPSIDEIVRENIKEIEKEYGVKITAVDIYNAREKLVKKFEESVTGVTTYEAWIFSPYFIFFEIPILRFVCRLPDGTEIEDLMFDRFKAYLSTQNIIILRLIELEARDKQLDNYIKQLLGEMGVTAGGGEVSLEELEKEYLIKLGEEEGKKKKASLPSLDFFKQIRSAVSKFLEFFGIKAALFRAEGPYEFIGPERLAKYYFKEVGTTFQMVVGYLKSAFGVPR